MFNSNTPIFSTDFILEVQEFFSCSVFKKLLLTYSVRMEMLIEKSIRKGLDPHTLIENDYLGDSIWSPEKDCCWLLTFGQPVLKPSSESVMVFSQLIFLSQLIVFSQLKVQNRIRVFSRYLTRSLRSLVGYRLEHSKRNFTSPRVHCGKI